MELPIVNKKIDTDISKLLIKGMKLMLSLMMIIILIVIGYGVIKIIFDMRSFLQEKLEIILQDVITQLFLLLAIVEVFKISLAYVLEGRVKVTFVVDAILVVMLSEIMSAWYKNADFTKMATLSMLIVVLGIMRVLAIKYSPNGEE